MCRGLMGNNSWASVKRVIASVHVTKADVIPSMAGVNYRRARNKDSGGCC